MIGTVLGTIAIVACAIAIGVVVDRKLGVLPRPDKLLAPAKAPQLTHAAGEAPAAAIRAAPAQVVKLRETQRCSSCRCVMTNIDDDAVQFNGRQLLVVSFRCPQCSAKRSLYIDPA